MRICLLVVVLTIGGLPCKGQVEFVQKSDRVVIRIDGADFTELRFGKTEHKPYLYPLRTASGKVVTRGFPENPQPGEDDDRPHQRGVWIGHEGVSGVDYFEVDPQGYKGRPTGSLIFKDVTAAIGGSRAGVLAFVNDWVHPNGTVIITERRAFRFYAGTKDSRMFDIEFRLRARQAVDMTDHRDSVLGLKLGKSFEPRYGGVVKNFMGMEGDTLVNGRRSPWVTLEGEAGDGRAAVTVMDHPDNFGFPARWRATARGSVFVSNFGNRAFQPKYKPVPSTVKDMGVKLQPGDELVFRYRVVIHATTVDAHALWLRFATAPPSQLTVGSAADLSLSATDAR
jgi:hypothetical protein